MIALSGHRMGKNWCILIRAGVLRWTPVHQVSGWKRCSTTTSCILPHENPLLVGVGRASYPRWSGQGDELFYVDAIENELMVVDVDTRSDFLPGKPKMLFTGEQLQIQLSHQSDFFPDVAT